MLLYAAVYPFFHVLVVLGCESYFFSGGCAFCAFVLWSICEEGLFLYYARTAVCVAWLFVLLFTGYRVQFVVANIFTNVRLRKALACCFAA